MRHLHSTGIVADGALAPAAFLGADTIVIDMTADLCDERAVAPVRSRRTPRIAAAQARHRLRPGAPDVGTKAARHRRGDLRRHPWIEAVLVLALSGLGGGAQASVVQAPIIGVFGGVITAGNVLHDPNIASVTYLDNATTAFHSIVNSGSTTTTGSPPIQTTGSALIWGDDDSGNGQPSTLDFFGAVIPSNITTPFLVGRLTFGNGTSNLTSLIFGATISFYDGVVTPAAFLGTDTIVINTTSNLGAAVSQDADFLNICGNQSNICASSIDAIESSQGGTGVTVDLYGTIVGDPMLFLDAVAVVPGQSSTTNGFVGSDAPLALAVPEPSGPALLAIAFLGPLVSLRRRSHGRRGLAGASVVPAA